MKLNTIPLIYWSFQKNSFYQPLSVTEISPLLFTFFKVIWNALKIFIFAVWNTASDAKWFPHWITLAAHDSQQFSTFSVGFPQDYMLLLLQWYRIKIIVHPSRIQERKLFKVRKYFSQSLWNWIFSYLLSFVFRIPNCSFVYFLSHISHVDTLDFFCWLGFIREL